MLEEVREARAARLLVLRADVEPLIHVDDRQLAIDVQDDLQAVRQRVLLELDLRRRGRGRCRRRLRRGLWLLIGPGRRGRLAIRGRALDFNRGRLRRVRCRDGRDSRDRHEAEQQVGGAVHSAPAYPKALGLGGVWGGFRVLGLGRRRARARRGLNLGHLGKNAGRGRAARGKWLWDNRLSPPSPPPDRRRRASADRSGRSAAW